MPEKLFVLQGLKEPIQWLHHANFTVENSFAAQPEVVFADILRCVGESQDRIHTIATDNLLTPLVYPAFLELLAKLTAFATLGEQREALANGTEKLLLDTQSAVGWTRRIFYDVKTKVVTTTVEANAKSKQVSYTLDLIPETVTSPAQIHGTTTEFNRVEGCVAYFPKTEHVEIYGETIVQEQVKISSDKKQVDGQSGNRVVFDTGVDNTGKTFFYPSTRWGDLPTFSGLKGLRRV